jgi:hypothetical protein
MPNRLLKEGIVDSSAIDGLTPEEEVFFYRLLVVADDFGRMDARLPILKSRCFPLKDSVKIEKLDNWLQSIVRQGLAIRYQVEEKPYLQILKWEQRVRSKSKYPSVDDGQLTDNCQTDDGLGKGKGKGKGASNTISFDAENNSFIGITDETLSLWKQAYPAVNFQSEMAKAIVWLKSNPTKRKSNYGKFLSGWFSRCQDSGGTKGVVSTSKPWDNAT